MYYFYALYSLKDGSLYKGTSSDPTKRFTRHHSRGDKSTAHRKPLLLILLEEFPDKNQALKQERWNGFEKESLLLKGCCRPLLFTAVI